MFNTVYRERTTIKRLNEGRKHCKNYKGQDVLQPQLTTKTLILCGRLYFSTNKGLSGRQLIIDYTMFISLISENRLTTKLEFKKLCAKMFSKFQTQEQKLRRKEKGPS